VGRIGDWSGNNSGRNTPSSGSSRCVSSIILFGNYLSIIVEVALEVLVHLVLAQAVEEYLEDRKTMTTTMTRIRRVRPGLLVASGGRSFIPAYLYLSSFIG
jgi:hypothetical protein